MDSAADRSPCAWLERLVVFEYTRAAQRGVQPPGGGVAFLDCLDPRGLVLDLPACGLEKRFHSLSLDDDHAIGIANHEVAGANGHAADGHRVPDSA